MPVAGLDTSAVSLPTVSIPALPSLTLSETEVATMNTLIAQATFERLELLSTQVYYLAQQEITNLKIAIPDELADKLRTLVGWAAIAVDPYVERLSVEGFRLPGETDVNQDLADLWDGNRLAAEQSLAFTDALSMRRAYWTVGSGDSPGDLPRICVESPLNMAVRWNLRGDMARDALRWFEVDGRPHIMLETLNQSTHMARNDQGAWEVVDRDVHNFGFLPVVRMANNPLTMARGGRSEITPALISIIDSACRRLLGLEVASELYSAPQKLILGATEADFQDSAGATKSAWTTYITSLLALERDEDGNVPEVHQFQVYDPAVFTKVIEMYASQAAGILAAVPQDLGLYTDGNPTSADSWDAMETRRNRKAIRKQAIFGTALVEVMQMAQRFLNGGRLPEQFKRMAVDWMPPSMPSLAQTADPVTKLIAAGALPARSDVTLKRAGFSAVERAQIEQDWLEQDGRTALEQIRVGLTAPKPAPADANAG